MFSRRFVAEEHTVTLLGTLSCAVAQEIGLRGGRFALEADLLTIAGFCSFLLVAARP
jgi:hypothetical protein